MKSSFDPKRFEENLLVTPDGSVMEGRSSNVFVLIDPSDDVESITAEEKENDHGRGKWKKENDGKEVFLLQTADSGVLEGTVRNHVLQIFRSRGTKSSESDDWQLEDDDHAQRLHFQLQAANLRDLRKWRGIFLTSTSRQILPVNELHIQVSRTAFLEAQQRRLAGETRVASLDEEREKEQENGGVDDLERLLAEIVLENSGGTEGIAEGKENSILETENLDDFVVGILRFDSPDIIRKTLPGILKQTLQDESSPIFP